MSKKPVRLGTGRSLSMIARALNCPTLCAQSRRRPRFFSRARRLRRLYCHVKGKKHRYDTGRRSFCCNRLSRILRNRFLTALQRGPFPPLFTKLGIELSPRPTQLLVISAHWEVPGRGVAVTTSARPPLLYDYYGFPAHSYKIEWPAPGSPALASRVEELLRPLGLPVAQEDRRGLDHGVFVPLKLV